MPLIVSVLLAVRDGERYLRAAIDSVLAEGVHELIVVDDGSTDATPSILAEYGSRIVALRQEPSGPAAALNLALTRASGDVLGFQDADDLWVEGRQAVLLAALQPGVDAVYGSIEQFLSPDLPANDAARLRVAEGPLPSQLLTTLLVRRTAFDTVGTFDENLLSGYNLDWTSRARAVPLEVAVVPEVVVRRRVHATNYGRRRAVENRIDLTRVMRAHLERKRAQ